MIAGEGEREALFIARANAAKRFIQTVGMFALCIATAIVATAMNMAGLVALMAGASTISGTLSFLWLIERGGQHADPERVPRVLRSIIGTGILLIFTVAGAVTSSLTLGAMAGMSASLLVYGAEFAVAVSMRYRGLLRATQG